MQHIEYTCDLCRERISPERAYQLTVRPVFLRSTRWEAEDRTPEDRAQRAAASVAALRDRIRRQLNTDICDSCVAQFRKWMETRRGN